MKDGKAVTLPINESAGSLSRMDQQECANHECYEERESGALQREDRAPSYFGMSASDLS